MIAIRGARSRIAQALIALLPEGEAVAAIGRDEPLPLDADRYLFCNGLLLGKSRAAQSQAEIAATWEVNVWSVVKACEPVLAENPKARICVLGSESALAGSFDESYAAAKARLHRWVKSTPLTHPGQQLVAIAPSIIADTGMTMRRTDWDSLTERARCHPKGRFLSAAEVARLIHFLLYVDEGYVTNTVIRMNGGSHTR